MGISSKWGARPSRSLLATSRCEPLQHPAFGGTPTAARETHALPISPANWNSFIPIWSKIGLEQEETKEAENSFLFSRRSLLTLFAPVETPCFVIAHRARCLAFAVKRIGENR